jgi:hypothetical protein
MMPDQPVSRTQAIRQLRSDRQRTMSLIEQLPPRAFTRHGLGGGEWSPKDLLGHLESWEEHALAALAAWERGERAPLEDSPGVDRLNRDEVERKASRSAKQIRDASSATHAELLRVFEELSDERWDAPAKARSRKTLGSRLGSILGGDVGPFRHDPAHWDDLAAFGAEHR